MLSNKTIETIRKSLQWVGSDYILEKLGKEHLKEDFRKALDEFNEYICDIEDLNNDEECDT